MTSEPPEAEPRTSSVPPKTLMPPFAALRAFDAVARLGGIRKAATMLNIDHTVVSRHLRALESWVGVTLIERLAGGISLTPEGRRYHAAVASAIDDIAAATLGLLKDRDGSQLQIWCMPGFAFQWLLPRIGALEAANPGMAIEVRPSDHPPNFSAHEADADIRYSATYDPLPGLPNSMRSVVLATPDVIPVASPAYLAARPEIETAQDLLSHTLLHEENFLNWRTWLDSQDAEDSSPMKGPRLWHGHLTVDAAKRGRGIALVNSFLAGDALRQGDLIEVGKGKFAPVSLGAYHLYARADRWTAAPIATFRRWLLKAIAHASGD